MWTLPPSVQYNLKGTGQFGHAVEHYFHSIYWRQYFKQTWSSTSSKSSECLHKTYACQGGREKWHKNSGVCHTGEDVRGLVSGSMLDILSVSKVKDKMLHPVPPTIKREAKCLVILFGVWGWHLGILLWSFLGWSECLLILRGSKTR